MKNNSEKLRPTEPGGLFLAVRHKIGEVAWKLMEREYGENFLDAESLKNLAEANQFLKTGSIVFYVNHQVMLDAPIAISLVLKHLNNAKNLLGPAGMKHFDVKRDPIPAMILRALRIFHIYALPIVQHNDEMASNYQDSDKLAMATILRELAEKALGAPGNVYGIAPEGTRNKTGKLLEGRYGIGRLRNLHQPDQVGYLPVAIIYPDSGQSESFQIKVGRMVLLPEIVYIDPEDEEIAQTIAVTDALMHQLANLLPLEMRGHYSERNK